MNPFQSVQGESVSGAARPLFDRSHWSVLVAGAFIVSRVEEICRGAVKRGRRYPILSLALLLSPSLCSPFSRDYSHIVLVAAGGDDGGGGGGGAERKLKTFLQTDLMFMFVLSSISPAERGTERVGGREGATAPFSSSFFAAMAFSRCMAEWR